MIGWETSSELVALVQVIFIDLVLAGDNAIVVGMAAARVAPDKRTLVITGGIAAAVVLRILFAAVTTQILAVVGLSIAGGILLLWVCWRLYRDIREQREEDAGAEIFDAGAHLSGLRSAGAAVHDARVRAAMVQVAVADVSMSLDNVLAVAGAAEGHMSALVVGLTFSVILMGIGAACVARLIQRYHWIAYLGLALITYVAIQMILTGTMEVVEAAEL